MMEADLMEVRDKSRVRNRMAMDMGTLERELRSEIENYGEYFYPSELARIKLLMREARKLAKAINGE